MPHNIQWANYFNNENPVDLEIGTGRTHFLFERALNFPERNIVGVEWKFQFVEQANRRIIREGIPNVAAFHGNAWLLIPLLFAPNSIAQVFVNFPDPWWKMRHKKRLVLNEPFLDALAQRMRQDGFLVIQTDVRELLEAYGSLIKNHGAFKPDLLTDQQAITTKLKAKSHREKKCLSQALPIFRQIFYKKPAL